MPLNKLPSTPNRSKKSKRLGCGCASGHGETSGRGNKGGNARSGYSTPHNFSGIPWYRKFPKRGFNNARFKTIYHIVNLGTLGALLPDDCQAVIDAKVLAKCGAIKRADASVKLLGNGDWKRPLTFRVHKVSASARKKIEAVGGKIEIVSGLHETVSEAKK